MRYKLADSRRFVAVVLTTIGGFALVVGSHDVFAARGLSARLFGALLAAAGLLMVVAAVGVFRRTSWHLALSLVGSFAAFLVGVALLLAQVDAGGRSQMFVIWIAVVVAAAVALVLSLGPGVEHVSKAVRRVQLAAAGGIVIGVAQFVFTSVYGPTPGGPTLTIRSALERIGQAPAKGGLVAVRARITIDNTSRRKVLVVDSFYTVTGSRVTRRTDRAAFFNQLASAAQNEDPVQDDDTAPIRDAVETGGDLLRAEQVVPRGEWFEPGESETRQFIIYVPAGRFDLLHLFAEFVLADYGRLSIGEPILGPKRVKRTYYGERYWVVSSEWKVHETSWVRRIIRGDSVLRSFWFIGPAGEPQLWMDAYIDHAGASWQPSGYTTRYPSRVAKLNDQYGFIQTESSSELPLSRSAGAR